MPMTMGQRETQLRQQEAYVGFVSLQNIMGTTTKFEVQGWRVKEGITPEAGRSSFSFPPNDPKYLAEFVRALNYPHLYLSMSLTSRVPSSLATPRRTLLIGWKCFQSGAWPALGG